MRRDTLDVITASSETRWRTIFPLTRRGTGRLVLWGDALFGGGTGMHHQPPRPELPTDDDELRALLARLFPLPRCAEPPDLSDSDSDDD